MQFLKTMVSTAASKAQNYYENYTKQQKLKDQLKRSTYSEDVKFVIEKATKQVFQIYPNFRSETLQFIERNQYKRFIELKSAIPIEIKGQKQNIETCLLLTQRFPKESPYVRIVKTQQNSVVNIFYHPLQSPNDSKSFILNRVLAQCQNWNESKSIVNIIIEVNNLLKARLPFIRPSNNPQGQNNQYGDYTMNYQNGQKAVMNQNYMSNNQSTKSLGQIVSNSQNFVASSKKILDKLKTEHLKAVETIQYLQIIANEISSQEQYLRNENMKMAHFLRKNEGSSLRDTKIISMNDEKSEKILDLVTSIKGRDDCIGFLQHNFNEGEINFEQFIKHTRRMQEEKFEQKFMLMKYLQAHK